MALQAGTDYEFFPKVSVAEGKMAGMNTTMGCTLCTKKYLFIIPERTIGARIAFTKIQKYGYFVDGEPAVKGMEKLLADDSLTVSDLEETLLAMLESDADNRIFEVANLDKFNLTTGLFGQARIKKPGKPLKVLVTQGKGTKKRLKAFYS